MCSRNDRSRPEHRVRGATEHGMPERPALRAGSRDGCYGIRTPRPPACQAGSLPDVARLRSTNSTSVDLIRLQPTPIDRSARTALAPSLSALALSIQKTRKNEVSSYGACGTRTRHLRLANPTDYPTDLTPTDRIGLTEPKLACSSNVSSHRSTAVRSHGARTAAVWVDNTSDRCYPFRRERFSLNA